MKASSDPKFVVAVAAVLWGSAMMLQGCEGGGGGGSLGAVPADHGGYRKSGDLISSVCSDAANKDMGKLGTVVHEELEKIEKECAENEESLIKPCEDKRVSGIQRAQKNVTLFYIDHCIEHLKTELEGEPTLEKAHPAADNFETSHADEIKNEFTSQMQSETMKDENGPMTTFEVLCMDEMSKNIEDDGDLVHEHLNEIEEGCKSQKDASVCESSVVKALIEGKGRVMTEFVDHCLKLDTWTLHAIHPAIDNFGEKHKAEVKAALHHSIHAAMSKFIPDSEADAGEVTLPSKGTPNLGLTADHTGYRKNGDLIESVCSDATHKDMAKAGDLIHEHLKEIEQGCSKETDEAVLKKCEDEQVAGIARAQKNVTLFYIDHCVMHVKEDLGSNAATLELAHPAADKFEEGHATEINDELHAQLHLEMDKKETGPMTTPEVLCMDEIAKDVENDDGLVHEHLNEIETGCKGKGEGASKCEEGAVKALVEGKGKVMQAFVDHCLSPSTWSLHAIHPTVDNFGEMHKAEVQKALHEQIHAAMSESGLESVTEAFSLEPRVAIGQEPFKAVGSAFGCVAAAASLAGAFLVRRRMVTMMSEQEDQAELLTNEA